MAEYKVIHIKNLRSNNKKVIIQYYKTLVLYVYCYMSAESQKRRPLLGNGSLDAFPRRPTHVIAVTDTNATIE
jgi:hypothetical protein